MTEGQNSLAPPLGLINLGIRGFLILRLFHSPLPSSRAG